MNTQGRPSDRHYRLLNTQRKPRDSGRVYQDEFARLSLTHSPMPWLTTTLHEQAPSAQHFMTFKSHDGRRRSGDKGKNRTEAHKCQDGLPKTSWPLTLSATSAWPRLGRPALAIADLIAPREGSGIHSPTTSLPPLTPTSDDLSDGEPAALRQPLSSIPSPALDMKAAARPYRSHSTCSTPRSGALSLLPADHS